MWNKFPNLPNNEDLFNLPLSSYHYVVIFGYVVTSCFLTTTTYLVGVYTSDLERVWICNAEADLASQNINERDFFFLKE